MTGVLKRLRSSLSTAPVVMLARIGGAGAGFLAQLVLARMLTPEDMGKFFAATSLAAVVGLLAAQGFPSIVQRFVTRYSHKQQQAVLVAFVGWIRREAAIAGVGVGLLAMAAAALVPSIATDTRILIAATGVSVCAAIAFSIYPAFAYAQRRFAVGLLPEIVARPVFFLLILAAIGGMAADLSAGVATLTYAAISTILAFVQFFVVERSLPSGHAVAVSAKRRGIWRKEAALLLLVALFTTLFTDIVILIATPFLAAESLAPFGVALKISMLIGFTVQVTHQIASPDLAEARQQRDGAKMASALLRSTLSPVVLTLAALVTVVFWGDAVLALFGRPYQTALWSLAILLFAQLVRAIAGPASVLLTLHGAQRTNAAISLISVAVLFLATAVLGAALGLMGAAIAVVICVGTWAGLNAVMLWRLAGLRADIFVFLTRSQGIILAARGEAVRNWGRPWRA